MKKKLVIVNGAPGSGKTTIINSLRKHTDATVIEKDAIKEFYFDYVGIGDRDWSRALGKASVDAMFALADQLLYIKDVLILETAFYAPATREDLNRLAGHHNFDVLEIYCQLDEQIRKDRFANRATNARHPGHADLLAPNEAAENIDRYVPLNVGEIIRVNTAENIDMERLVGAIRVFIGKESE